MECPPLWPHRPTPPKSVRNRRRPPTGQLWCICNFNIGNVGRGHQTVLDVRRDIGTSKATFSASPSKWESHCSAAVASSQPLESTIASKTCRYCSQLVVPPNRGTFVVMNAACRGVRTTGGTPGVRNSRFSVRISGKSCCI